MTLLLGVPVAACWFACLPACLPAVNQPGTYYTIDTQGVSVSAVTCPVDTYRCALGCTSCSSGGSAPSLEPRANTAGCFHAQHTEAGAAGDSKGYTKLNTPGAPTGATPAWSSAQRATGRFCPLSHLLPACPPACLLCVCSPGLRKQRTCGAFRLATHTVLPAQHLAACLSCQQFDHSTRFLGINTEALNAAQCAGICVLWLCCCSAMPYRFQHRRPDRTDIALQVW